MRMARSLIFLLVIASSLANGARKIDAAEAREREVSFPAAAGVSLAGTLTLPAGGDGNRFPALVLVAGSGPTDRDGNQAPSLVTDVLKQIAHALADQGVASLRFDKRGMHANAGQLPKETKQYNEFFSWNNFIGDVERAYEFLCQTTEINPAQVGLLGHSEGGLFALAAAGDLTTNGNSPKALVLLNSPGRTADKYIAEQLVRLLKIQKASTEQTKFFLDQNDRITKSILETGVVPGDVPAGLKAIYPSGLGKFLKSLLSTDPCVLIAAYAGPVLVVAGTRDVQISSERDGKALDASLRKRASDDHELLIVEDASHNLKRVANDVEPGFAGPVVPKVLDRVSRWSAQKLSGKPKR